MKVIIAGSRSITDLNVVKQAVIESGFIRCIGEVVCGCADGIDKLGYEWARANEILVSFWPAWTKQQVWALNVFTPVDDMRYHDRFIGKEVVYSRPPKVLGRWAGFKRNANMAHYAHKLIAVWDGESSGTRNMINTMKSLDKPVFVRKVGVKQGMLF